MHNSKRLLRSATRHLLGSLVGVGIIVASPMTAAAGEAGALITDGIFPSNLWTATGQNGSLRVNLPKPDCEVRKSDCADIDVLNGLDGFSTQPRLSVRFESEIDLATVSSSSIFLVNLGETQTSRGRGNRVGIDQLVWDASTNTLFAESGDLLEERSIYLLVVTDAVRTADGQTATVARSDGHDANPAYGAALSDALAILPESVNVTAASVFTTRSVTHELRAIQADIAGKTLAPFDFAIATQDGAAVPAVFDLDAIDSFDFIRDTGPAGTPTTDQPALSQLALRGAVAGRIAYGRYRAPNYLNDLLQLPTAAEAGTAPQASGEHEVIAQIILPAGEQPAAGWPVAIIGHGWGGTMIEASLRVASTFTAKGIATVAINVVGHGSGPDGRLEVGLKENGTVTVPAGGRGRDNNQDGKFDNTEGAYALPPVAAMIGNSDTQKQTIIDLVQLVNQIEAGVDIDGNGTADLDGNRIYFVGQSYGGMYGTAFFAIEPRVRAAVLNVAGGSILETTRLGAYNWSRAIELAVRTPPLNNRPSAGDGTKPMDLRFDDGIPLRGLAPKTDLAPGALEVAEVFDRAEWVQQPVNPVSYAALIRKAPPEGMAARPVIFQIAKGDQAAPNPTSTAILRAGDLADRALYYRYDLVRAQDPSLPADPHAFLTAINHEKLVEYAIATQEQIAEFFVSDGQNTIDPDGDGDVFEMPIKGPLPEELNYLD